MYMQTSRTVIFGLFLLLIAFGQSTITYADWVSMPGTNWAVAALAIDKSGNLYAGGSFCVAGGVSANHVARWDGNAWSALGSGTNGPPSWVCVQSLACDDSGNVYAGGSFDSAGGIKTNHIARWDGKAWSALGNGTDNKVTALAVDHSGYVYAGGEFNNAGDVSANKVARWDGRAWSALGGGINGGTINALVCGGSGIVYVCIGYLIFKWDGSKWDTLGGVSMNSSIFCLAIDKSNNLYAGGGFGAIGYGKWGTASVKNIAMFNGASWSAAAGGSQFPLYISKLAIDNSCNMYVETANSQTVFVDIERWDCKLDSVNTIGGYMGQGAYPVLDALCTDNAGNLYIGGSFHYLGGIPVSNIAKYVIPSTVAESRHGGIFGGHTRAAFHNGQFLFSLSQSSSVRYEIFDFAGRILLRSELPVLAAGSHSVKIATGDLCPGVYILDFRAGDQSFKGKFSIMK
jgi:hypothetical protein